jgi:hypothetical protein
MKILRIILYILGGLFIALLGLFAYFLIFVDPYMDNASQPGITQTMSVGGKTVHAVMKGAASYSMTNEGNDVIVNGKKLDLSGGDEFTVEINADGTTTVRPGKP